METVSVEELSVEAAELRKKLKEAELEVIRCTRAENEDIEANKTCMKMIRAALETNAVHGLIEGIERLVENRNALQMDLREALDTIEERGKKGNP